MLSQQTVSRLPLPRFLLSVIALAFLILLTACNANTPPPPNTMIYGVSRNGTVFAMSGKDGSMRWSHHMSGDNGSIWGAAGGLVLDKGVIYTSSSVSGGYAYAFQAQSGTILWQKQMPSTTLSSLVGSGNTLYVGVDTSLYALRASDGKQLWQVRVGNHGPYSPVIIGSTIYIVSPYDPNLYALREENGAALWNYQTQGYFAGSFPIVDNGVLYFSMAGTIFELAASDGTPIASYTLNDSSLWVGSPLSVGS